MSAHRASSSKSSSGMSAGFGHFGLARPGSPATLRGHGNS